MNYHDKEDFESFRHLLWIAFLVSFTSFVAFICIINYRITHKMIKAITKPLEVLTSGVRQIHENNFSYRIDYSDDDEFSSVCTAFNKMATQLEESRSQRIKDEASRRELFAGISHDLRTPLTTIKGCIEGIETGVASTPERRDKYFLAIKNKTTSMEQIIERLFLFSKLDMDEFPFTPRRVDIMRALNDMIEDLSEEYRERGLNISITNKIENAFVNIDTVFFRNAIINIFENSVLYKAKESAVSEISFAVLPDSVVIRFADDGPGVSEDALPKLFDVFYRTDPSRHKKGSGIGLAIVAKVLEKFCGTIRAENNTGGGLAIVISLPLEKMEKTEEITEGDL
jgi:signal transduction histidine kinase